MTTVTVTPSIENVPKTAIRVTYVENGAALHYHYWESRGKWVWQALGNSHEEPTSELARAAARRWIKSRQ